MATGVKSVSSTVLMDDGARLHVKVIGDDQGREKPLLIALHGAPGASTHLESEASFSFLRRTFRVLVYDARGSGDSDDRGPYSHDRWVKDLEILRSWQQAEKFILAGGSYGAFVALDYAITHGDRLHGLVVRAPWPNGVQGALNALANIMTSDRLTVDKARQVRNWSGTLRDNQDMQEALTEILPYFAPPEGAASREQAESTEFKGAAKFHFVAQNYAFSINMPPFDVRKQLTNIKCPTLVIVGRYDNITPVSGAEEIAKSVPNARLEIFEHSGHSPPSDEPVLFEEKLSAWLIADVLPTIGR